MKVWVVVPGKRKEITDAVGRNRAFENKDAAYSYAEWWKYDQGREDTVVVETNLIDLVVEFE